MLNSMLNMMCAMIFPLVVMITTLIISTKKNMDREKTTPFECGFDPNSSARIPFSLRFFLLAVIFLVFDIEIVLLIPIPMSILMNTNMMIMSALVFLMILIIGLLHEWREGSLNWQM